MSRYSDQLVIAARGGDRDAIAELLLAAQPDIRRYARRSCRTTGDAEDAAQEALLVLSRRLKGLKEAARLSAWLFTIVRRHCERLARTMVGASLEAAEGEERMILRPTAELRIDIAAAIQSLPDHYRTVILLRDVQEFTIDEIALELGATRETVKARLHRARQFIREYISA